MPEKTLEKNGLNLPPLGIGVWAWGDTLFWNYGKDYGFEDVKQAFHSAITNGVTFFDTAEVYGLGESERLLGQFIKEVSPQVQIATKYFPLPWRFGKKAVADALTASLKRLDVAQIDLYQVHMPFDFFMGQKTLMEALADEVKQGRILAVGVSNYSAEKMKKAYDLLADRGVTLAVNQVSYSLLKRDIESNGVLDTARQLGVKILAYSPLAQGLLTGKYNIETPSQLQGGRKIDPRFSASGLKKIQPLLSLLKELGEKYNKTPAQVALNWLIAQGDVIPIPGAKNAKQAMENAGASGWLLTPEDVAQLASLSQPF